MGPELSGEATGGAFGASGTTLRPPVDEIMPGTTTVAKLRCGKEVSLRITLCLHARNLVVKEFEKWGPKLKANQCLSLCVCLDFYDLYFLLGFEFWKCF